MWIEPTSHPVLPARSTLQISPLSVPVPVCAAGGPPLDTRAKTTARSAHTGGRFLERITPPDRVLRREAIATIGRGPYARLSRLFPSFLRSLTLMFVPDRVCLVVSALHRSHEPQQLLLAEPINLCKG